MRHLIIAVLLLSLCYCASAQDQIIIDHFPVIDGKICYQEVVQADSSLSAAQLKANAQKWMVIAFKSSKDVTQIESDDMLIAKAYIEKGHNEFAKNAKKWFNLTIEFKDGRYKYTLTDVIYEFDIYYGGHKHYEEQFDQWLKYSTAGSKRRQEKTNKKLSMYARQVNAKFEKLINSLKESMSQSGSEDDNW